jgi:hypothetical protein
MPANKYELRSSDVQEVMSNPPHSFIAWGNTLILLLLITGMFCLNRITIPYRIILPFQLTKVESSLYADTNQKFALLIDGSYLQNNSNHQPVSITFESYPSNLYGTIKTIIDTVILYNNKNYVFVKSFKSGTVNGNKQFAIELKLPLSGSATIQTGQSNLFEEIKKRIFRID